MKKYTENMFNAIEEGKNIKKVGNHTMKNIDGTIHLLYHGYPIVKINTVDKVIMVNNYGYYTNSTTQAINSHLQGIRKYFDFYNFMKVDATFDKKFENRIKNELNCKVVFDNEEYIQLAKINNHKEII